MAGYVIKHERWLGARDGGQPWIDLESVLAFGVMEDQWGFETRWVLLTHGHKLYGLEVPLAVLEKAVWERKV